MSGDYAALSAAWSGLSGTTTVKKIQALNALMVAGQPADLPLNVITDFVRNSGKLAGIVAFATNPPATPDPAALLAANYLLVLLSGQSGQVVPAASLSALLALLAAISADARTGVSAANFTAFTNICTPPLEWWKVHGFSGPITLFDLMAAGNLS